MHEHAAQPHRTTPAWRAVALKGQSFAAAVEALGEALADAVSAGDLNPRKLGQTTRDLVDRARFDALARNRAGVRIFHAVTRGNLDVSSWPPSVRLAISRVIEVEQLI